VKEQGNRTESIRWAYSPSLGGPAMSTSSKRHHRSRESKERPRKSGGCCVLSFRFSNPATIPFPLFHPSFLPFVFLSFFLLSLHPFPSPTYLLITREKKKKKKKKKKKEEERQSPLPTSLLSFTYIYPQLLWIEVLSKRTSLMNYRINK
jgi:hypothetical protein